MIANEIVISSKLNQGHTSIVNLQDHSHQTYIQEVLQSIKVSDIELVIHAKTKGIEEETDDIISRPDYLISHPSSVV